MGEMKAQDFEAFHDMMWASDTKWTMELMQQKFADDLRVGFQGQWTKGLDATFAHWLPMKEGGLMKQHKTIGCEVLTWSESMVSFMDNSVMTTFEDKELFLPIQGGQLERTRNDRQDILRPEQKVRGGVEWTRRIVFVCSAVSAE